VPFDKVRPGDIVQDKDAYGTWEVIRVGPGGIEVRSTDKGTLGGPKHDVFLREDYTPHGVVVLKRAPKKKIGPKLIDYEEVREGDVVGLPHLVGKWKVVAKVENTGDDSVIVAKLDDKTDKYAVYTIRPDDVPGFALWYRKDEYDADKPEDEQPGRVEPPRYRVAQLHKIEFKDVNRGDILHLPNDVFTYHLVTHVSSDGKWIDSIKVTNAEAASWASGELSGDDVLAMAAARRGEHWRDGSIAMKRGILRSFEGKPEMFSDNMSEDRSGLDASPIMQTTTRNGAIETFKREHPNVGLFGWEDRKNDTAGVREILAGLDLVLKQYPDVQVREIHASAPSEFKSDNVLAHMMPKFAPRRYTNAKGETDYTAEAFSTLHMNKRYLQNPELFHNAYKRTVDESYHYPVGNVGPWAAVMTHEFGHALDHHVFQGQLLRGVGHWDKDKYPTVKQGKNVSVLLALNNAYLDSIGERRGRRINPKSDDWNDYLVWLETHLSGYGRNRETRNVVDAQGKIGPNYDEAIAEAFADIFANGEDASPASKALHELLVRQYKGKYFGIKRKYEKEVDRGTITNPT
jgi:hypothetical protein